MKLIFSLTFLALLQYGYGQVTLDADGPGDTYELITSVLAPGYNPIEVPDCDHEAFGQHIDEVFDDELDTNVFRFYIHTTPDNDRCINFDRQRNEIKSYDQSPDNLLGVQDEKVVYKWKFKLPQGFQSSSKFTHIHQLKSVGGDLASMPMYTLTTRKGSPDQLELRYSETVSQVTLDKTDITPLLGQWVEVTETIKYGFSGSYEIEIKNIESGEVLFEYSNFSIINWREGADFVRPKWGIYRSLEFPEDLRDEAVLFANFSVEEIETSSTSNDTNLDNEESIIYSNPVSSTIYITNTNKNIDLIQIHGLDGSKLLQEKISSKNDINLDVSSLANGTYMLSIKGDKLNQSSLVLVYK